VVTVAGPGSDPAHPDWYEFEERVGPDPRPVETAGSAEKVITVHFRHRRSGEREGWRERHSFAVNEGKIGQSEIATDYTS
jgi:hypothetical protein